MCWSPDVARGGRRRSGNPSPIIALDLSRRSEARFRPAARILDSSHSSIVSTTFNSKVEDFAARLSSMPRLASQGPTMARTSSPVLPGGTIFLKSSFPAGNSEEPWLSEGGCESFFDRVGQAIGWRWSGRGSLGLGRAGGSRASINRIESQCRGSPVGPPVDQCIFPNQ